MKILFITGLYPQVDELILRNMIRKGSLQYAPNEYQWRVVEGFVENKADIYVLSMPFFPCFPKYKSIFTKHQHIEYRGEVIGECLKYCNVPFIKEYSLRFRLRHRIRKFINEYKNEKIIIITYNSLGFMQAAIKPLKKRHNIKVVSLITDLIDDATNSVFNLSFLKYIQARLEQKRIWGSYNYTDGFILLSKFMTEKIPQAINKHIVIEGIAKSCTPKELFLKTDKIKSIVYTGVLSEYSGVRNLVDAFLQTKNPYFKLIICGSGELKDYIIKKSQIDTRIEFKGVVFHDEAIKIQREATVVVNPRLPSVSLTRYSFPSKTIEYLLSGTPMIGYKLDGIPEEYYDYIFTPNDNSTQSLSHLIDRVLSLKPEDLRERAVSAQNFIRDNKTAVKQVFKILLFLKEL